MGSSASGRPIRADAGGDAALKLSGHRDVEVVDADATRKVVIDRRQVSSTVKRSAAIVRRPAAAHMGARPPADVIRKFLGFSFSDRTGWVWSQESG